MPAAGITATTALCKPYSLQGPGDSFLKVVFKSSTYGIAFFCHERSGAYVSTLTRDGDIPTSCIPVIISQIVAAIDEADMAVSLLLLRDSSVCLDFVTVDRSQVFQTVCSGNLSTVGVCRPFLSADSVVRFCGQNVSSTFIDSSTKYTHARVINARYARLIRFGPKCCRSRSLTPLVAQLRLEYLESKIWLPS
jgi:hypothetical protein